jgi:hypothetical protein
LKNGSPHAGIKSCAEGRSLSVNWLSLVRYLVIKDRRFPVGTVIISTAIPAVNFFFQPRRLPFQPAATTLMNATLPLLERLVNSLFT